VTTPDAVWKAPVTAAEQLDRLRAQSMAALPVREIRTETIEGYWSDWEALRTAPNGELLNLFPSVLLDEIGWLQRGEAYLCLPDGRGYRARQRLPPATARASAGAPGAAAASPVGEDHRPARSGHPRRPARVLHGLSRLVRPSSRCRRGRSNARPVAGRRGMAPFRAVARSLSAPLRRLARLIGRRAEHSQRGEATRQVRCFHLEERLRLA